MSHSSHADAGFRAHWLVASDAFVLAAALFFIVIGLDTFALEGPSPVTALIGSLSLPGSAIVGAVIAWKLLRRPLTGRAWLGLLVGFLGAVLAVAAIGGVLIGLARLLRLDTIPGLSEGPWHLVLVATLLTVTFLSVPVVAGVRDLAARREPRRNWLRLGLLVALLAVVGWTLALGGEGAEAGLFALGPAFAGAGAAAGMDVLAGRIRHDETPTPQPASSSGA